MRKKGEVKMNEAYIEHQPGVLRVRQTKDQTMWFYNKIAGFYDILSNRFEEPLRKKGIQMLNPKPGEHILEIGFGTGTSLIELAKSVQPNGKISGIDISEKMLEIAKKRAVESGLEDIVELTCGDAKTLPYEQESLDGIFMSFTLELFDTPDIIPVLNECRRVLKTGGRISVVSMSRFCPQRISTKIFEWIHRHFPRWFDCRPIFVKYALKDAGFEITESTLKNTWANVEIVRGVKNTE